METRLNVCFRNRIFASEVCKIYYSSSSTKDKEADEEKPKCTKKAVCKKDKEKKKSFLGGLMGKKSRGPPKPIPECCKTKDVCEPEPNLSAFGGEVFKTCGSAYIVQKDVVASDPCKISKVDKILKVIEAGLGLKSNATDPMPPFTTVEQRMMDLDVRKLHPLYKVYQNVPKRNRLGFPQRSTYKTRSGPINSNEIPVQFKYNRELLEKKNMFADYKRVEPPRQLMAKIVELKQNERPTMRKKVPVVPPDAQVDVTKKKTVYETLYQGDTKF